jgi:hypothetical protein
LPALPPLPSSPPPQLPSLPPLPQPRAMLPPLPRAVTPPIVEHVGTFERLDTKSNLLAPRLRRDRTKLYGGGAAAIAIVVASYAALRAGSRDTARVATTVETVAPAPPPATRAPKPTSVAKPAPPPAPAPARAPIAPPRAQVTVATTPAGATVALVDDGRAALVGTTPLALSIDPDRAYDVVLVLSDHATRIEHLAPHGASSLAFDLAPATPRPRPPARAVRAPARIAAAPPAKPAPAAKSAPAAKPASSAKPAPAQVRGGGTLAISTKPPCEIVVDGKSTHMTTPQRSLALAAGAHKITLFNREQKIARTLDVVIAAGRPTKLVQDFTRKK